MFIRKKATIGIIALLLVISQYTESAYSQRRTREDAEQALQKRKALLAGIETKAPEIAAQYFVEDCDKNTWTTVLEKKIYGSGRGDTVEQSFLQFKNISTGKFVDYAEVGEITKANYPDVEYASNFTFNAGMMRSRKNADGENWSLWENVNDPVLYIELWYQKGRWQINKIQFQREYNEDKKSLKFLYKPTCQEVQRGITNTLYKRMKNEEESWQRAMEAGRAEREAKKNGQENAKALLISLLSPCQDGRFYFAKIPASTQVYGERSVYKIRSYDYKIWNFDGKELMGSLEVKAEHCWFNGDERRGFTRGNCVDGVTPISFKLDVATQTLDVRHTGGFKLVPCNQVREVMSLFNR